MKMKLKPLYVASALALAMASGAASAVNIFPYESTIFEDDDLDRLAIDLNSNGQIDVGDVLQSTIEIIQLVDAKGVGSTISVASLGVELTGVLWSQVTAKIEVAGDGDGIAEAGELIRIEYGVYAPFGATLPNGGYANAIVAMYLDDTPDLDLATCVSIAACNAAATDGVLWQVDGFVDNDDQFWNSGLGGQVDNVALASTLGATTKVTTLNYAFSVLYNGTGYQLTAAKIDCVIGFSCPGDGKTGVVGSGDVLGGLDLTNGFAVRSDFDFLKNRVPEPASLGLMGIGLLGLAAARRRKAAV